MPNTVVKLTNAESTWLEAAREDRKLLIKKEALTVMASAFLLCATFEVMGFCGGNGAYRYSRRLTPCGRGLRQPPGLMALGCQGSACDRLRLTGRLRAFALGSYIAPLRWRGGRPFGRHFFYAAFGGVNHTTALRARKTGQPRSARVTASPLARFAGLPPQAVAEQPVLMVVRLMKGLLCGSLLCWSQA